MCRRTHLRPQRRTRRHNREAQPRVHAHQAEEHERRRVVADTEVQKDAEAEAGSDRNMVRSRRQWEAVPPPGIRFKLFMV